MSGGSSQFGHERALNILPCMIKIIKNRCLHGRLFRKSLYCCPCEHIEYQKRIVTCYIDDIIQIDIQMYMFFKDKNMKTFKCIIHLRVHLISLCFLPCVSQFPHVLVFCLLARNYYNDILLEGFLPVN